MSRRRILAVAIILALGLSIYIAMRPSTSQQSNTSALQFSAAESDSLQITHLVTVGDRVYTVEVASTAEQQAQGLSNRGSMPEASGMLFPFRPAQIVSFWMKDMRFNLDLIWIANGRVIGIERDVPKPSPSTEPQNLPTYSPPAPVDYVLELNAGQGRFFSIGDEVTVTQIQAT